MTRINVNLVKELSDELLINALGEETRILTSVINRIEKGQRFDDIPEQFTLGTGHIKFFFDKIGYIKYRYFELRLEYENRFGKPYSLDHLYVFEKRYSMIYEFSIKLCRNWQPTEKDTNLVKNRIFERSQNYKRSHHYNGEIINDWKKQLKM